MARRHPTAPRAKGHSGGHTPGESAVKHAELHAFLQDMLPLIQEKYDATLGPPHAGESEADYQFRNGQNFAYYESLGIAQK